MIFTNHSLIHILKLINELQSIFRLSIERNQIKVIDFELRIISIHSVRLLLTKTFKQTRNVFLEKKCKEILYGHESYLCFLLTNFLSLLALK